MLVLSRKEGERINIGDNIRVVIVQCRDGKVRIGVEAPDDVTILRGELARRLQAAALETATAQK